MYFWWVTLNPRNHFLFEGKKSNLFMSFAKVEVVVDSFKRIKLKGQEHIEKPAKNNRRRLHFVDGIKPMWILLLMRKIRKQGWELSLENMASRLW